MPSLSFALTAGPTAPEFSSFEPVDTTDLVNLATGELVYNMPVLEVPGPEGSYPLSLSYHAGIKLDQEASWVGLGWTLNPGAINRTVNGYADDNVQVKRQVRDYWDGGTQKTKTYSLGITIPKTGISANYSLARTRDTFKGFSSNYNLSVSATRGRATMTVNVGGSSTSANQMGRPTIRSVEGKIGLPGSSSMGISISSKSVKTNLSILGGINPGAKNNMAGSGTSFTKETDIGTAPIGMFGSFAIKDFYTRYWSDASQSLFTYGSLYPGLGNEKIQSDFYVNGELQSFAFDSYDLYDEAPTAPAGQPANTVDDVTDPTKQLGGSLPAFDRYDVLGQGVGGVIQPHIFENGDMFGQNFYQRGPEGQPASAYPILGYKSLKKFTDKKVDFRFLNDFSNALTINTPQLEVNNGTTVPLESHTVNASVDGFNSGGRNQKLAGSKHVEWFTNQEIANGTAQVAGFMDCYANKAERKLEFDVYENYLQPEAALPYHGALTYGRAYGSFKNDTYEPVTDPYKDILSPQFHSLKPTKADLRKKIGGFMVTNETGVTYHYALPVYNYNEYTRSKLKHPRKGVPTFREYKNDDPYAYTWLLTAVTGPDYVDRNNNNILDDDDWGYWVKFDYGRWADAYQWRTPHTGYVDDIESEYQTFSYGIKELYYLDAVETRSHKAIFIKSKRKDGRGVTSRLEGGSNPRRFRMHYKFGIGLESTGELEFNVSPVSTMKLDAIYLFKKNDLNTIPVTKASGSMYNEATTSQPHAFPYKHDPYTYTIPGNPSKTTTIKDGEDYVYVKYHNGDLVYDDDDIYNTPQFREKALRVIEFKTDYSLAAGVPNSIGFFSDLTNRYCREYPATTCDETDIKIGDNYEWPEYFTMQGVGYCSIQPGDNPNCCEHNELFYSETGVFQVFGDRGQGCPELNSDYVGNNFRYAKTGKLTLIELKFLGKGGADLLSPTTFAYRDNPPYESYRYDNWGYHKSDYTNGIEGQTREITTTSTTKTDAWSLSSITSPLGAKTEIEYEPNEYRTSVYNDFSVLSIEKLEPGTGPNEVKITFKEKGMNLGKWFSTGNTVDVKAFILQAISGSYTFSDVTYPGDASDQVTAVDGYKDEDNDDDFIIVNSAALRDRITAKSNPTTVQYFISGFIKVNDPYSLPRYAGGIRVHALSIIDSHLGTSTTVFDYKDPVTGDPSGVTSFKPFNQPSVQYPVDVAFFDHILEDSDKKTQRKELEAMQINFQKMINEPFTKFLTFSKEAPAPGAVYEWVKVTSAVNNIPSENYTVHHFNVFKENMIEKEETTASGTALDRRVVTIKNNTIDVGSILSIKSYDNQGVPLTSLDYQYLYGDDTEAFEENTIASNQGVVEQSFHKSVILREYKVNINRDNWWEDTFGGGEAPEVDVVYKKDKALITKRRDRSNIVTAVIETDHKKGLVTETQNHAFDFFSGQVLKTVTSDSYGNKYLNVVVPAYKHYPDMGLKIYDVHNKNMITQAAELSAYLLGADSQPAGLLSASVQTWRSNIPVLDVSNGPGNIWRMHASYQWNGQESLNSNGTYKIEDFNSNSFNWSDPSLNQHWEKTAEVTLYDAYSHDLEGKDINGNFASTRRDREQANIITSAVNASYYETVYAGAESYEGATTEQGSADRGQGNLSSAQAHTGQYSLLTGTGATGFNYTFTSGKADLTKKYRASVWVYAPGYSETQDELNKIELYYTVNGQETKVHPTLQKNKSKSWYLLNLDITPLGLADIYIGVRNNSQRAVYFDDFRVHPLDAAVTSYVYDPVTDELTYILDSKNFYTRFEYDAMGRLIRTSKELLNFDFGDGKESYRADMILKEVKYNYKNH